MSVDFWQSLSIIGLTVWALLHVINHHWRDHR